MHETSHREDPARLLGALPAARRLDVFVARAARIANLVATAPTAPVPTCPRWSAADLARHVTDVLAWATRALREPGDERPRWRDSDTPDPAVARALLDQATVTADVLRDLPIDLPVWTWAWGRAPAAFWHRRLVHEVVVHAVDAELAAGLAPTPVAADVAGDGVDELLATQVVVRAGEPGFTVAAGDDPDDLHLHAVDDPAPAPGEWLVTCTPDGPVVTHEHRRARVALRGTANDLLLALWRRTDWSALDVHGDDGDVARWQRRLAGLRL